MSNVNDKLDLIDNRRLRFGKAERELIERLVSDEFDEDSFIDALVGYEDVGRNANTGANQYIKAVQFVVYVIGGMKYTDAYKRTHPDRCVGKESNYISTYASNYANTKLVKEIMQRAMVNNSMLFVDKEFKARKKLFEIGMAGESKTNVEALKVFLDNQYRDKEKAGIDFTVNVGDSGAIDDINDALTRLAEKQSEAISKGWIDLKGVAESKIKENKDI